MPTLKEKIEELKKDLNDQEIIKLLETYKEGVVDAFFGAIIRIRDIDYLKNPFILAIDLEEHNLSKSGTWISWYKTLVLYFKEGKNLEKITTEKIKTSHNSYNIKIKSFDKGKVRIEWDGALYEFNLRTKTYEKIS